MVAINLITFHFLVIYCLLNGKENKFTMKLKLQLLSAVLFTTALVACSPEATKTVEPVIEIENQEEGHDLQATKWSYTGDTGPESWGELDQTYASCVNGSEQSPINIEFSNVATKDMNATLDIQYEQTSFSVVNNGHTIQVDNSSETNKITLEGTDYRLVQFHFHTPSEHQFNGQQFPLELHLVHQNDKEELVVLGVMIQEGVENESLSSLWDGLPKEKTTDSSLMNENVNLQDLLPKEPALYYYEGSLTTPPCTEKVRWVLLEQPIEMSKKQIEAFQEIIPHNSRPVQPLNEREINKN